MTSRASGFAAASPAFASMPLPRSSRTRRPGRAYVLGPDGKPVINAYGDKQVESIYTDNLPEVHGVLRQLRQATDAAGGGRVALIGETYLRSIADLRKMYGPGNDGLELPMDMQVGFINKFDVSLFRQRIDDAETQIGGDEPLFVFDNHDNPRWDRYQIGAQGTPDFGYGPYHNDIGRVIATVLFASRDTAMMYYGDEIGMVTTPPARKQDVKDPIGITGWPKEKGRDGERTPMQWDAAPGAGFSTPGVKTWLPIPPSSPTVNVAAEEREANSLLHWYQQIIALKKRDPACTRARRSCSTPPTNTSCPGCAKPRMEKLSWLHATLLPSRSPSASS